MTTTAQVNLSGLLRSVTVTNEPLVDWFSDKPNRDKRPLKLIDDPFALSVYSWRVYQDPGRARWLELEICTPSDEDRALAQEMCSYYRDKIGMLGLTGKPMSKFQQELYGILVDDHTELQEQHRGMLHRLPYFYQEDMERRALSDQFTGIMTLTHPYDLSLNFPTSTKNLTPVKRLLHSRKSNESIEYWFTDNQGLPVLFKMLYNSALRNMFDGLFKQPSIELTGEYRLGQLREANFVHWFLNNPELVLTV